MAGAAGRLDHVVVLGGGDGGRDRGACVDPTDGRNRSAGLRVRSTKGSVVVGRAVNALPDQLRLPLGGGVEPGTVWDFTVVPGFPMLSVNGGTKRWTSTSRQHRDLREGAFAQAARLGLPKGVGKVRIDVVLRFPKGARRDPLNYYPHVVKPLVDGLGPERRFTQRRKGVTVPVVALGWGLVADDSPGFVEGPSITIGPVVKPESGVYAPYGLVEVRITVVEP